MSEQKIIDRIKALVALAESEAEQTINPNAESVAANILAKAHELARKHRIDLQSVKSTEEISLEEVFVNNLGKTIIPNPFVRSNAKLNRRTIWFEELAKVIAEGFYCKLGIRAESGEVSFYGYDSDREIAIFMLQKIAEIANRVCTVQLEKTKSKVGTTEFVLGKGNTVVHPKIWMGDENFVDSFHFGYRQAIEEIFKNKSSEDEPKNDDVNEYYAANIRSENPSYWESSINIKWNSKNEPIIELGKLFGSKAVSEKNGNGKVKTSSSNNALTIRKSLKSKKQIESNHAGDIYFLIDNSGSMNWGEKLDQAKKGIIDYANQVVGQNYKIGLIRFGSFAKHVTIPISDDEKFAKLVEKMNTTYKENYQSIGDNTRLANAIKQATERFLSRNIRRVICIATDGHVYDSIESLQMAELAKANGIEIMTIGTEDADHEFLEKLASKPKLALKAKTKELESGIKSMVQLLGE